MSADRLPWDEAERAFRVHDLCPQKAGAGVRAICPHCLDDPAGGWLYVERVGEDARPVCDAGCKPAAIVAALRAPADHEAPARGLRPPVLKAAALHGPAGELVRTIDPHTEADPAATLIQFLLAFGNACGRGLGFRVESDDHGVNEFAAIVGDTAKARKGTSWGHVRRLMQMVDWAWAEGCIASGVASGEGLIHAVRDPVVTRRKARKGEQADKDGRIEVEDDPGVDDKRLFVIQGELAQVLRVMRKDGNTVSPVVRDLWDSGNARNMSKGSPQRTTEAHVSMVGHITHRELVQELTEVESANGFANRWLWVWARRSKRLPRGGDLSDWTLAALAEPIRNALRFAKKLRDEGQATLDMTEDAWGVWEVLYERLAEGEDDLTGAITARAEAHVRRLAVIYALLDQRSIVGIEHLQAAIAVWDYCEASARFDLR